VISSDSESEEDEVLPKPKARAAPKTAAKKAPAAKKAKADDKADGALKEETKKKFK
jgi:hypothetical protein